LAFHTSVKEMFYVLFHFKLIESPPYSHFHGLVFIVPCHGHIMFLLHDSLLAHRFGTTSILIVFPSRWCLSPLSNLAIFLIILKQNDLTHRPCLFFAHGHFLPWRWPLVLKSWSRVFPFGNLPSDSTHHELHCLDLVCELIPRLAMLRYCAILATSLRPKVGFQNTSKKHCPWNFLFYASLGNDATSWNNIVWHTTPFHELAIIVMFHKAFHIQKKLDVPPTWGPLQKWSCSHLCELQIIWWSWEISNHGWTKVFLSSPQMPFVNFLSIRKMFFFWGDLKVVSLFARILLWTFNRSWRSLGRIEFLWPQLVFSNHLWFTIS